MEVRQRNRANFLQSPVVKNHSYYCESKGPVVEEGFVAARIRAIQGAYNQTSVSSWSHSPMIPCLMYQRLEKHESYPLLSETQTPSKALRLQSIQPAGMLVDSFIKPFMEGNSGHGPLIEQGQSSSGGKTDVEPRKIELESDAQAPIPEHSSIPMSEQKAQQAPQQGSSSETISLGESPRPNKHPLRRKTKEQVVHDDRIVDSLIIEPRDTGQYFFHPLASPKHIQHAFIPQSSAGAPSETPKPTDLRSLSTRPMTSQSHHEGGSVFPSQSCTSQKSNRAKPRDSVTPIKSPRRSVSHAPSFLHQFFSSTPDKASSVLSGTSPPQARRNWNGWKLFLTDTHSDDREILDKSLNLSVSDKVEPEDIGPHPKGSDVEYFKMRLVQEAEITPIISELRHDDKDRINPITQADTTVKAEDTRTRDHIQTPPDPRTFLTGASAEPEPTPPRQPNAQHHLHVRVANVPLEPFPEGSSGAASPVRLQATSSNGSSKRGNRGQNIKRVQVVVTLDGTSEVMVEANMKRMRML